MPHNQNKFINLIIKLFMTISAVIFVYTLYRSLAFYNGISSLGYISDKYLKYFLLSITFFCFFYIILFRNEEVKKNIILSISSTIFVFYSLEIFLTYRFNNNNLNNLQNNIVDLKSKAIKYKKFINNNIYPFQTNTEAVEINGVKIFPITSVSNIDTFLCDEDGKDVFYKSDKYGFRNNNENWIEKVDYVLIGDSFIHGACVENDKTISSQLSKIHNKNVLNLGIGGIGPLRELAIFNEYVIDLKPKKIFWFYSEGTDLTKNLRGESQNIFLRKYLNNYFTQNLKSQQKDIDELLFANSKNKLNSELDFDKKNRDNNVTINLILEKTKFLRLWSIRSLISGYFSSYKIDPDFSKIISIVKNTADEWGGEFYFVYMPDGKRYMSNFNRYVLKDKFRHKDKVLEILKKDEIKVIDIDKDIFDKSKNPLDEYYNQTKIHYNESANLLIANYLIK
tara:strand:- start:1332 stop:2684 length:1353 start_codon:yes stop_codon:yes gene_type:complete